MDKTNNIGQQKTVDLGDPSYPSLLAAISDPPNRLHVLGNLELLTREPAIAVVGTRKVTKYGVRVTEELTAGLVRSGFVIVSGFMYGVDRIAHETAMRLGGKTVGVLGFGFNYMYPREHQDLMRRMLTNGQTLISEFAPDVPPRPGNFPRRNRIVSGMSLGVLVTEAASKSGSKITARLAAEQGREVFTVPGPFDSIYSEGTKELVNLGAKLVTSIDDILEEIAI